MPWVRSPPPACPAPACPAPACPAPVCSVDDAVPDVRHGGGLDDPHHFERRPLAAERLEQSHAVSEEKWSDVDLSGPLPWVVLPGGRSAAEHPPAHDDRAGRAERLLDDVVVGIRLATGLAVAPTPRREAVGSLVEPLAALAERLLDRLVRPGDEAVERHRDVQRQLAHRSSQFGGYVRRSNAIETASRGST